MIGPQLQGAIYTALVAAGVAGGRVYVNVPASAVFPYVEYAGEQVIYDGTSCGDSWEVYVDLDVWVRPSDGDTLSPETAAKAIAAAVVEAAAIELSVPSYRVVIAVLESARDIDDPDGITKRRRITLRYLVDET